MRRLLLFAFAGGLAFVVDAGVLHLLVKGAGLNPYAGRVLSFVCAVTTTWWFNRTFTFSVSQRLPASMLREWGHYLVTQLGGFAVNYAVFAILVGLSPLVRQWPVIGVAAGSAGGLLVNFALASRYVFKAR